jgi:hypothetical protein
MKKLGCTGAKKKSMSWDNQAWPSAERRKASGDRNQTFPSLDFGLPAFVNCEKINFYCLIHPSCGIL